jgi:hypothetical protein
MRLAEVRLKGWMIADVMAELRIWLDHNDCVPKPFNENLGAESDRR